MKLFLLLNHHNHDYGDFSCRIIIPCTIISYVFLYISLLMLILLTFQEKYIEKSIIMSRVVISRVCTRNKNLKKTIESNYIGTMLIVVIETGYPYTYRAISQLSLAHYTPYPDHKRNHKTVRCRKLHEIFISKDDLSSTHALKYSLWITDLGNNKN